MFEITFDTRERVFAVTGAMVGGGDNRGLSVLGVRQLAAAVFAAQLQPANIVSLGAFHLVRLHEAA